MDKKDNKADNAVMTFGDGAVMRVTADDDNVACLQFPGGGKIKAILNKEGKPELQLIGPLSVGDLNINSKAEEEVDAA